MIGEDAPSSISWPRDLLSMHPEFSVVCKGDSMNDAGLTSGDVVTVICGVVPHDGDIVLASIDEESTIKVYCEDDEGYPWLVPQNKAYKPIPLKDKVNVRIIGCVKEIIKKAPRVAYRECMNVIKEAKQASAKKREISQERVTFVIKKMAEWVEIGRQWYAVYKPMEEKEVVEIGDYASFCSRVRQEVPNHEHQPVEDELQRMAVQSFRKGVRKWNPNDAPVKGKRFTAYQRIGLMTLALLESEESED